MTKRLSTDEFIMKSKIIWPNNEYDYKFVIYINGREKVKIYCNFHKEIFEQQGYTHLAGHGCPKCFGGKISDKNQFVEKAIKIHGDKYNYDSVIYVNTNTHVNIWCNIHNILYSQLPSCHLKATGCPKCKKKSKLNTFSFIEKAIKIHGDKFNYDKVKYKNTKTLVKILCKSHNGYFLQRPNSHLQGHGCDKCGGTQKYNTKSFIKKAIEIHGNIYNYKFTKYKFSNKNVIIVCYKHGKFNQTASSHLLGHGCSKCSKIISKGETEWLDSLNIKNNNRQKIIKCGDTWYKVDGFDPNTNTVYEYYGDFWHGNPDIYNPLDQNKYNKKYFGDLFLKTIEKEIKLKKYGYTIISIWENDLDNGKENKNAI